jgi:flagellar motor switch protein FliN
VSDEIMFDSPDLNRLADVPVELAVEIGRTRMTIGETLGLGPGSIVSLNRLAGEPVDLLVNGKPIARGEVVVIDEEFGLRLTEVVAPARRLGDSGGFEPAGEPEAGFDAPAFAVEEPIAEVAIEEDQVALTEDAVVEVPEASAPAE